MRRVLTWSARGVLFILAVSLASGCGMFGHGGPKEIAPPEAAATPDSAGANYEDQLRMQVKGELLATTSTADDAKGAVKRTRPYYFREYDVYPDGPDAMKIDITEEDSRIAPLVAEVKVNKQRYATRFHRKHDEAAADGDFLRGTGEEILTYEHRNGKWVRAGSLFVATTVERQVNGQWVKYQEDPTNPLAIREPEPGFVGRIWSSVFGR